MARKKDGKPRGVWIGGLDPLPYVKDLGGGEKVRANNDCGGFPVKFLPRDGYIQDEESYK